MHYRIIYVGFFILHRQKSIFMITYFIESSYKGPYNWFAASLLAKYKFLVEMHFMVFLLVIRLYRNLLRFVLCIVSTQSCLWIEIASGKRRKLDLQYTLIFSASVFQKYSHEKINVLISLDIQEDNLVHSVEKKLAFKCPKNRSCIIKINDLLKC